MVKKLIVSVLLVGSLASASEDNLRSFELETSTRYVRGRFDMETEGRTLLTIPTRPMKPRSEAVGVYTDRPRSMEESFLIEGADGRERIMETAKFPWSVHGQITMEFGGITFGGSGVLVGPHHFLTAAHNVYKSDRLEPAKKIKVRLGLNDEVSLFGEVLGTKVYLYDQWMRSGNHDYDIALVILNQSIGLETGWAGLLCLEDGELNEHRVHVTGYPGDKGLKTLWTMEDTISRVTPYKLHYLIDTYKGQSGGAIWIKKWALPHVLGVHAYEGTIMDGGNYGVRLSESKIRTIVGWIRETLVIDEPAEPVRSSARRGGGREAPVTGGAGDAAWLSDIMVKWTHPWGMFWTWGGTDCKGIYDYLLSSEVLEDKSKNLYEKWTRSRRFHVAAAAHPRTGVRVKRHMKYNSIISTVRPRLTPYALDIESID